MEGGGGAPTPKPEKIIDVISEGSIVSNKFSKINKKFNFSSEVSSKIFKIFQQFVFFVQKREMLTHGLLKFVEKYAKNNAFLQFS